MSWICASFQLLGGDEGPACCEQRRGCAHNPMEFATGSSLAYELGLPKLMAKIKPMFCGWFRLEGYYESKSGYLTTVAVQTDSDGDFKVITMERLFMSVSPRQLAAIAWGACKALCSPITAGIATL